VAIPAVSFVAANLLPRMSLKGRKPALATRRRMTADSLFSHPAP
jgi:hypothetical protein